MEIKNLKTNPLNQNNYNINKHTPDQVGSLVVYPVNYTHENTLSCDGYVLLIEDYPLLYSVIGKKFNTGTEKTTEFRIPDYNVSGRFLQPSSSPATKKEAGLPNITGRMGNTDSASSSATGAFYRSGTSGKMENSNGSADPNIYFDASRSSSIYGNSSTVQPPSQGVLVCIRYK